MAEDDPELWHAIERLTCVMEGLNSEELHTDAGVMDFLKGVKNAVMDTIKSRPKFEEKAPALSLKSPNSEPFGTIQYLIKFYSEEAKKRVTDKIKDAKLPKEQKPVWQTVDTNIDALVKILKDQESELKIYSHNGQLCDYHAVNVDMLRKLIRPQLEALGVKENPPPIAQV